MVKNQKREEFLNENLEPRNNFEKNNDKGISNKQNNKQKKGSASPTRETTNATGYESSQRNDNAKVGPLDADLSERTSKRRSKTKNQTGPGLG